MLDYKEFNKLIEKESWVELFKLKKFYAWQHEQYIFNKLIKKYISDNSWKDTNIMIVSDDSDILITIKKVPKPEWIQWIKLTKAFVDEEI